jgi:hypothetical protein
MYNIIKFRNEKWNWGIYIYARTPKSHENNTTLSIPSIVTLP